MSSYTGVIIAVILLVSLAVQIKSQQVGEGYSSQAGNSGQKRKDIHQKPVLAQPDQLGELISNAESAPPDVLHSQENEFFVHLGPPDDVPGLPPGPPGIKKSSALSS